jgi:hypothetical protein
MDMAISTYGVTLRYGETTPTTEIEIKDFPSLLGKRSALETTTLKDDAQTFIQGIRQQSETFDFTANYDKTVMGTINGLTGVQQCELSFSDGSKFTWSGFLSASVNEGSVDAVVEMTISITPTTVPVFTAS